MLQPFKQNIMILHTITSSTCFIYFFN